MMKKIYYLGTCSTCARIINELGGLPEFEKQDIKTEKITKDQIEEMHSLKGSYEALFSRRAMKYRSMNLGSKNLTESDYKSLILDEYTFLKRPVILVGESIFVGSIKSEIEGVKKILGLIT